MKIRHRILLFLVLVSLAASLLVGLASLRVLRTSAREHLRERFHAETALLARWVASSIPPIDPQRVAVEAQRDLGARVTLIAPDGTVLGDSARNAESVKRMDNHIDRPEVRSALRDGSGETFRRSASTGVEFFYFARSVPGSGPVKIARIALPAVEVERLETRYAWLVAVIILSALTLVTSGAYLLVRRLSRPIERIAAEAEDAASGKRAHTIRYRTHDEVGRLAWSVNRMQRELWARIDDLEDQRRLLLSVIGNMKEGLLVVGPDHRIRLANAAAREVLGFPANPEGRLLAEVVRSPAVFRDLDAVLADGREARDGVMRIPASGRSFALNVTPLPGRDDSSGGALVLLFDITRLEALESVRREFVANVSHELRTPLTSIQAFVETLLEEGPSESQKTVEFLEIVRKHAGRMHALVEDLTDLSRIETGAVTLDIQEVDARAVAEEVVEALRHRTDPGIDLRVDLPSPFPLRADRRRLEQALVNLVDNAIKFNRPGGRVTISGSVEGDSALLRVEDTGVGIPDDSLEKVFHRFYRVDKARSREMGGTGLGLAIVKHLMHLHGGRVRLESELGRGSRFTLEFPRRSG